MNKLDDVKLYFNPTSLDRFSVTFHDMSPMNQERIIYLINIAELAKDLVDKTPEDVMDIYGLKRAIYGED